MINLIWLVVDSLQSGNDRSDEVTEFRGDRFQGSELRAYLEYIKNLPYSDVHDQLPPPLW